MLSWPVRSGLLTLVVAALVAGCAPGGDGGLDSDSGGGTGGNGIPGDADDLFSLDYLPVFKLTLSDASWAALEAEPKVWVPGTFEFEGEVIQPIGIRLKGNHSFRPLGDKPSFKLKFNEYVKGTRFLGLEELVLNNMVIDRSMMREWTSYRIFREIGAPAPRAGFAEVELNGEHYGLYVNLESYDDEFLELNYSDPLGNLYEEEGSVDVDDTDVSKWDQDEGEDKSRMDLMELAELANLPDDTIFYGDQAVIDMPRFFSFMIGEVITGQFDGYIGAHNFFIYHEPTPNLWTFLPWSLDQSLIRKNTPYDHEGFLAHKCLWSPTCLVDYVTHAASAVETFAAMDLQAELDRVEELTRAAVKRDKKKPHTTDQVEASRAGVRSWLTDRPDALREPLDCLVNGNEPDADGDGYGPCFQDCDESNEAINPDAEELCDGIDNDCSSYVDDVPACDCPSITSEGRTFYACHNNLTWLEADAYCKAQNRQLARFDSASQTAEVWAFASDIAGGRWSIGLNDRATEETYLWRDNTAPNHDLWAPGEPAHQLDWFDCVFLAGQGEWYELNCIEAGSFICSE